MQPVVSRDVAAASPNSGPRHPYPRRSLMQDKFALLFNAAERCPLAELRTLRTGASVGQPVANVRWAARRRAEQLGRERRIAYLIAVWTGLRRSEIRALTWGDVDLNGAVAAIRLPAETTKSSGPTVLSCTRSWPRRCASTGRAAPSCRTASSRPCRA